MTRDEFSAMLHDLLSLQNDIVHANLTGNRPEYLRAKRDRNVLKKNILDLLDADAIREAAREEELEACCSVLCFYCKAHYNGENVNKATKVDGAWVHDATEEQAYRLCQADYLRNARCL